LRYGLYAGQVSRAQEINIQNMNVELVSQMFKNYQSNVLIHLEGLLDSI
jgi:DASH complex subunit DAD4